MSLLTSLKSSYSVFFHDDAWCRLADCLSYCTSSGNRTRTTITGNKILSLARLPISPPRYVCRPTWTRTTNTSLEVRSYIPLTISPLVVLTCKFTLNISFSTTTELNHICSPNVALGNYSMHLCNSIYLTLSIGVLSV